VFEIRDTDLAGRTGKLCTKSGCIETPAFFPVIDPLRQEVPISEVASAGFRQVITNAYLAWKRYGERAAQEGIHSILGFKGVVMTDSGAYQILEYGDVEIGPREAVEYQASIGSDIGVILDVPTGDVGRREAEETVRETLRRAREALDYIRGAAGTLWVLPIQGGAHLDLVEHSARESRELYEHYDIIGVGSPTVFLERYDYPTIIEMILAVKKHVPWGKPVHLFGAGHPLIIPFAAAAGVDTFDSASYILYARDDRYMTDYGVERLERLEYFPCNCPVCSRYTPQELREMPRRERTRLLALHNLYTIARAINRTRQAIREGRLWELLEETARKHPRALDSLTVMAENTGMLEKATPRSKGVPRGLRVYDAISARRPKLYRLREAIKLYLKGRPGSHRAILLPYPDDAGECPTGPQWSEDLIAYYSPFIPLVPRELCGVYPTIHLDYPKRALDPELVEDSARAAAEALSEAGYTNVSLVAGRGWTEAMARALEKALSKAGIEVRISHVHS